MQLKRVNPCQTLDRLTFVSALTSCIPYAGILLPASCPPLCPGSRQTHSAPVSDRSAAQPAYCDRAEAYCNVTPISPITTSFDRVRSVSERSFFCALSGIRSIWAAPPGMGRP